MLLKFGVIVSYIGFAIFSQVNEPVFEWLSRGGTVGVLAFIVFAFVRRWIVTGSELKEVQDQRDRALELVYRQAGLTERAVNVADAQRAVLDKELEYLKERGR